MSESSRPGQGKSEDPGSSSVGIAFSLHLFLLMEALLRPPGRCMAGF